MTTTTDTRYGPTAHTADHALALVVEARISELLRFRKWYRAQPNWSNWMDLAHDHDAELRALVRLARRARHIAATAYPDPMTEAASYADWSEAELAGAFGR
jgi:hypothetical protein